MFIRGLSSLQIACIPEQLERYLNTSADDSTISSHYAKGGTLLHVSVPGCVQECACGRDALSVSVGPSQEENLTLLTLVGMRADSRKARQDVSTCNTKADVGISAVNWACRASVSPP